MIEGLTFIIDFLKKHDYYSIQRFPLRKYPILPSLLINEFDIFCRFLFKGNNLFSISIAPSIYLSIYSNSHLLLLRDCFFLNKSLPFTIWEQMLSKKWISQSLKKGLLRKEPDNGLCYIYRIVSYDKYYFVTSRFDRTESHFTFLSYDSLYFANFLLIRLKSLSFLRERALDICCGVGIQAFIISQFCRSTLGIDLNSHAIQFANINASINSFSSCKFKEGSLFSDVNGRFDLIVANPPFILNAPKEDIDSYGSEPFGLGVTYEILAGLPEFLNENGRAFIITRAPVFDNGDYLLKKLRDWLPSNFGWIYHYVSDSVCSLQSYEDELGIKKYRQVVLELFIGSHRQFRTYSFWHRKTNLF